MTVEAPKPTNYYVTFLMVLVFLTEILLGLYVYQRTNFPEDFLKNEVRQILNDPEICKLKCNNENQDKTNKELLEKFLEAYRLPNNRLIKFKRSVDTEQVPENVCDIIEKSCPLLAGPQGPPGVPGLHGLPGLKGYSGVSGLPGLKGERGYDGDFVKGQKGEKGERGLNGLPGLSGLKGVAGYPGLSGLPGRKGDSGLPGIPEQPIQGSTKIDRAEETKQHS